jgi:adenosyl cobinamide kinase/adenosyl cobinamide phosphate guanylyltransferase
MGVAPPTRLGNLFADLQGDLNQSLASACSKVYRLTAGIPARIK